MSFDDLRYQKQNKSSNITICNFDVYATDLSHLAHLTSLSLRNATLFSQCGQYPKPLLKLASLTLFDATYSLHPSWGKLNFKQLAPNLKSVFIRNYRNESVLQQFFFDGFQLDEFSVTSSTVILQFSNCSVQQLMIVDTELRNITTDQSFAVGQFVPEELRQYQFNLIDFIKEKKVADQEQTIQQSQAVEDIQYRNYYRTVQKNGGKRRNLINTTNCDSQAAQHDFRQDRNTLDLGLCATLNLLVEEVGQIKDLLAASLGNSGAQQALQHEILARDKSGKNELDSPTNQSTLVSKVNSLTNTNPIDNASENTKIIDAYQQSIHTSTKADNAKLQLLSELPEYHQNETIVRNQILQSESEEPEVVNSFLDQSMVAGQV